MRNLADSQFFSSYFCFLPPYYTMFPWAMSKMSLKDDIKVIIAIDGSGSTSNDRHYERETLKILHDNFTPDVTTVFTWGTDLRSAKTIEAAMDIVINRDNGGTDPMCLIKGITSVPNYAQARIVIITDGQVSRTDIKTAPRLSYREVDFYCVELDSRGGGTDRSLPMIFSNSSLSITYMRVPSVLEQNGDEGMVIERPLVGYDARKNDELIEEFFKALDRIEGARAAVSAEICDAELASRIPPLIMAVFDDSAKYHAVRDRIKKTVGKLLAVQKGKNGRARISCLQEVMSARRNDENSEAIAYLEDVIQRLARGVHSTDIRNDFKAPDLHRRGPHMQQAEILTAEEYEEELVPDPDFDDVKEGYGWVLPLRKVSETDFPAWMRDLMVATPMAEACVGFVAERLLMPLMEAGVYREWVQNRGNGHPLTRETVSAVVPVYDFSNGEEDQSSKVDVLKSHLAHALFDGSLTGPWSRYLAVVALAAERKAFVSQGVRSTLWSMTRWAMSSDVGPVTGTPLEPYPPHRSRQLLALQFWLASARMGFTRGGCNRLRTACQAPKGNEENLLRLVEMLLPRWEDRDPLFADLDMEKDVVERMRVYRGYNSLCKLFARNRTFAKRLVRTAFQNYIEFSDENGNVADFVFVSGPGNDNLLSRFGVPCCAGWVKAFYDCLCDQSNKKGAVDAWYDIEDVAPVSEEALPKPVMLEPLSDAWKESIPLSEKTCRPMLIDDHKFSHEDAVKRFGAHYLPAHRVYGDLVTYKGVARPHAKDVIVALASRARTQSGDDDAVLPGEAAAVAQLVIEEFEELRSKHPEIQDPKIFGDRFRASCLFESRLRMQKKADGA